MGTGPVERPSYGHCARNLFKWIKQHLKVKRFIGRSKNAVWTQLWIATCMYLLLAYQPVAKGLSLSRSAQPA